MTWETNKTKQQQESTVCGSKGGEKDRKGSNYDPQALNILTEIDRSLNPRPKLARDHSTPIHRTHKVPAGKGVIATRQLPSTPSFERTETP